MPKTAVIYARFSCNKQREASIDDQLRVCRDWCRREGYAIAAEYCDYAMSGRTDDRPEFQRMIACAGESDIVLVYMMDRFSRDEYDAPIYKRQLKKAGVEVVSAMEALPDGPERILVEKIYEGLAAVESEKISVRTKRGMEGNALKCRTNGQRIYGYRRGEGDVYEIDPQQAPFVREAFSRRVARESIGSIARDFAERGVRTTFGNRCGYQMVYTMLRNRRYTGRYEWGGVVVEGGMPAIVEEGTFMAAQRVHGGKDRESESWGAFALSGKAVCGCCGRNMQGTSGRGRHNVKYEYYSCPNGCMRAARREELEECVAGGIRDVLADRAEAVRIARMVAEHACGKQAAARRRQARKALNEADKGLRNIVAAIEQGIIAPGIKERIAELESQKARAEADLKSIDAERIDAEGLADFLQDSAAMDAATLLDAFVYQVVVCEDYVMAILNYDAETGEPARFEAGRVRTNCVWLPTGETSRTEISAFGRVVVLRIPR